MVSLNDTLGPHRVINIEDLRRLAHRRLPRAVFDYLDGGAEDENTLRENCRAFQDITFRPRSAVAVKECNLGVRVLGQELSFPAMLAPVGYSRLMHPGGEVAAAKAAGQGGTGYILSTISGHKLEAVKTATKGPAWYQLYLLGGREAAEAGIDRARRAGYSALVITVDTAVAGMRERDPRNGMKELLGNSLFAKLPYLPEILAHPRWLAAFLADGGLPKLENIVIPGQGPMQLVDVAAALADATVTWDDLRWIRNVWPGLIVVKGILAREDAERAVDEGAAAVVVSNHGGPTRFGVRHDPRSSGSCRGGEWSNGSPHGRGNPSRKRYRESYLPRRTRRARRTCLCVRIGCCRISRCRACPGNFAKRRRKNPSTSWLPVRLRVGPGLC